MDFFNIGVAETKTGMSVYPDFVVGRTKDLMVRGKHFHAIWDEEAGRWSTDEYDVQRLVDKDLKAFAEEETAKSGLKYNVKYLRSFGSNGWSQFRKYLQNISDNSHDLDTSLTFANTTVKKTDYASKRLPYPLERGACPAWDELVSTLYSPEERQKIEWSIGAIVSGDSKKIQKFLVLYGPGGTGKSTILNIIEALFEGYTTSFDAKALGSTNGDFATEAFSDNPLVAIQQDGDLSKIEDNTRLNSIIAHERMRVNQKYKPTYDMQMHTFLYMGTNQPVRITDSKSGIIRRLIDVNPTGNRLPPNKYQTLMSQIQFELGAIAHHCLDIYRELGKNHYNNYRPVEMMMQTDVFFNFIEAHYDLFKMQDGVSLKQAYILYKEFCAETGIERPLPRHKVGGELRNYFDEFKDRANVGGEVIRSYYVGFNANKFKAPKNDEPTAFSLVMEEETSILDDILAEMPAQLTTSEGTPKKRWENVKTVLKDIDTTELHYVKMDRENHIVIDFDLKDDDGEKSLEKNLAAASDWPATYAEYSKSGKGVHLHYIYDGDVSELATDYDEGIEVKVYKGNGALRRKLSKCNAVPIATINSGLPIKEKPVLSATTIQSEKNLRDLIARNLRKEIHPGTKPSIDFIKKILDDANAQGLVYDVSDLQPRLISFANNSSNQPLVALRTVMDMKFTGGSPEVSAVMAKAVETSPEVSDKLTFYDVEVFPNLVIVCYKHQGKDQKVVTLINPKPADVEPLLKMLLVGFNCRRYDNHILYAIYMGYTIEAIYNLSKKIIDNKGGMFGEAYNLSYADIYDFSSKKQSLKKFQIELKLTHIENVFDWDSPVDEKHWVEIASYCANDVVTTEATFEAREQDFIARKILADLSGLSVNDTTQKHTARIIFGSDRAPQRSFIYTELSTMFEGYSFDFGKSTYRDEEIGEGGYVYAEPGIHENVALLDVASMHPTSIELLNAFGDYTPNFSALKQARLAIKHGDYDGARAMLNGKLAPYLQKEEDAEALSYALKIVINIVYGLTSAKFDNPFRDPRNKDNIVAKRGALFMVDLKHAVQEKGFTVAHIKTDSIKIPNATPEIIEFVKEFGSKYGYDFEHEATYSKMALVNDAVYIAQYGWAEKTKKIGTWEAVGAQFQHPYVYKALFGKQDPVFEDYCETKQVTKGAIYLDFDAVRKPMHKYEGMHHVGRIGRFVPVTENSGGGVLYRVDHNDKGEETRHAVSGTKGHLWVEAEIARMHGKDLEIDMSYFEDLVDNAKKTIRKFGDYEAFVA